MVIGIDQDAEQIKSAQSFVDYHAQLFGFSNIKFFQSESKSAKLPMGDESVDVLIFHNVLSSRTQTESISLMKECHRVLKQGGEMFFSDSFSSIRIPHYLQNDATLWNGHPFQSAIYTEDLRRIMSSAGFPDVRVVESTKMSSGNPETEAKMRKIGLSVRTLRTFKLDALEDRWEYFGQEAIYQGTIEGHASLFVFDCDRIFLPGQPVPIDGNTATILSNSRYRPHFFVSQQQEHQGLFQVAPNF